MKCGFFKHLTIKTKCDTRDLQKVPLGLNVLLIFSADFLDN